MQFSNTYYKRNLRIRSVCSVLGCFNITKRPVYSLLKYTKHRKFRNSQKFCSLMKKKFHLDGPDDLQRYWRGKDLTSEMFSTRHRGEVSIILWGAFFYRDTLQLQVLQGRQIVAGYVRMLQRSALVTEGPRLCGDEWHFQMGKCCNTQCSPHFDILAREWDPCFRSSRLLT